MFLTPIYSGYRNWWLDHFETTPPIPTYAVAALVGELRKSTKSKDNNVTVYTSEDYLSQTDYVVGETSELFEALVNYTECPIEMNKIDFLSLPDFAGDSTENWGLNAYRYARNSCLLSTLCSFGQLLFVQYSYNFIDY